MKARENTQSAKLRKRRKYHTETYRGFKLRYIVPDADDAHTEPYWTADNCKMGADRKRKSCKLKADAMKFAEDNESEGRDYGKKFSVTDEQRAEVFTALKKANGRATLTDIVKFWADRHPVDGKKIPVSKYTTEYMDKLAADNARPATIRAARQKIAIFTEAIGNDTPIAAIWEDDVNRFVDGRTGGDESRRAWKKFLNAFFRYCLKRKAIKVNPATRIELPKKVKKSPDIWSPSEVKSMLRLAANQEPEIAAGLAILFFAGLRPTELVGQYGLQDARLTEVKDTAKQARKNYNAEKRRLGLVRGRGFDTREQAEQRKILVESEQAKTLEKAIKKLAEARKEYEGKPMPGLQWKDVRLDDPEDMFIHVRAETSKVNEARNVDIMPNLAQWLEKYRKAGGAVVPNPTLFRRARRRIVKKMEAEWKADIPRHSFASYFYKHFGNRDKLAEMLGHTAESREIERHYKKTTASKADAAKYWKIVPTDAAQADIEQPQLKRKGA